MVDDGFERKSSDDLYFNNNKSLSTIKYLGHLSVGLNSSRWQHEVRLHGRARNGTLPGDWDWLGLPRGKIPRD